MIYGFRGGHEDSIQKLLLHILDRNRIGESERNTGQKWFLL
jgi:hypothetical protein